MSYSCRTQVYLHRKMVHKKYNSGFVEATKASSDNWEANAKTSDMTLFILHVSGSVFAVSAFLGFFVRPINFDFTYISAFLSTAYEFKTRAA